MMNTLRRMRSIIYQSLFLCVLASSSGCAGNQERVTVDVEVEGVPDDVSLLQVSTTLQGRAGIPAVQLVTQPPWSFSLSLPAVTMGTVELKLQGQDRFGCVVAEGSTQTASVVADPFQLRVKLDRVPICVFASRIEEFLSDVWGSGPSDIWAVGAEGPRHWDGVAWAPVSSYSPRDLLGIWGSGPNDVWAVGSRNQIVHWDGKDWGAFLSGIAGPYSFQAVWGSGPNDVWAVGNGGIVVHWDGAAWTPAPLPLLDMPSLYDVWGSGPNDVWAVGHAEFDGRAQGLIVHWDGVSWNLVPVPQSAVDPLFGVWGSGPNDVWAVGSGILHWNGAAWTPVPVGIIGRFRDVSGSGPNDVWAAGGGLLFGQSVGSLLHWDGAAWVPVLISSGIPEGVWTSGPHDGWAVGDKFIRFRQ